MRTLLKVSIPVERGNEAATSGALPRTVQELMEKLKPEAAYFYPENGLRTALFVFDLEGSEQLPPTLEPLFLNLNAAVTLTPVMNADDLQRGFELAGIAP
ncbi:MAG TPA: hypothetical protein VNK94_01005 [Gaiellaceae bacterium]|jgi:hypothetical protein|nr:hypothetical protein [Gaiellaceae bacterium]